MSIGPRSARRAPTAIAVAFAAALVAACGGGSVPATQTPQSAGQVAPAAAAPKVTHYAASRFAEQASFGATPALVAELRAKGFEQWIDEQFALPFVPIDVKPAEEVYKVASNVDIPRKISTYFDREFIRLSLTGPDQLRLRVMWSLSLFIVASRTASAPSGDVTWANVLYRHAFGRYGELLRETSTNRLMGWYLNNDQNRPKTDVCPHCAPNENYARELMQLFSIGVFKLNPDGTPQRDARGRFVETYMQADVEELARALTGWTSDENPPNRPSRNWANWTKPMVPSTRAHERDAGRKEVMGRVFPAGQNASKDLDDIVEMLMAHPNIAPFVALRLIQHLVKSDPSPAYVGRVAAKFRDNGSGVAGDLKAVVKAILLDAEARRGDDPANARVDDGKFREPWLHRMATLRGLGCQRSFVFVEADGTEDYWVLWLQRALNPDSVFGYYAPTDRAPGSNLLAPEQRLVDAVELTQRLKEVQDLGWNRALRVRDMKPLTDAGCDMARFVDAYARSPKDFLDLVSERYFRGAMPPTLRSNLEQMIRQPTWNAASPSEGAMRMLGVAISTPTFGVIK